MSTYKRSQVEDAIIAFSGRWTDQTSKELRSAMKRLLDRDRKKVATRKPIYAFSTFEPEGQGKDIEFTDYDAFALLTGLRLLSSGWSQGMVLSLLRDLRGELKNTHTEILRMVDPTLTPEQIRARAAPGSMFIESSRPVFLAIFSAWSERPRRARPNSWAVIWGERELMQRLKTKMQSCHSIELSVAAHALAQQLSQTEPRTRGRPSARTKR